MTADDTGSTNCSFSVTDRYPPATKSPYFGGYQFRLTGRVRIVADFAGSPFVSLVHMNKVQIEHAVPEVSLRVGALLIGQGVVMAVKTEGVLSFIEREIKIFRVVLFQQMRKTVP